MEEDLEISRSEMEKKFIDLNEDIKSFIENPTQENKRKVNESMAKFNAEKNRLSSRIKSYYGFWHGYE